MIELLEKRKGYVSKEIYDPIQNQAKTYFEFRRPHMQKIIQNNCNLSCLHKNEDFSY